MRIGIVAPACPIDASVAERVTARAEALYGERVALGFHPQCFLSRGHFAGDDDVRAAAFVEMANDPAIDAIWFARGGYGSVRIAEQALVALGEAARAKTYLGYSDTGVLLGALHASGIGEAAHGPMPSDIRRNGGEAVIDRALRWLVERDPAALEPSIGEEQPTVAFNLTVLASMIGTPFVPDLAGHVLMIEEIGEFHYRVDRAFAQIASSGFGDAYGLRLGRFSDVTENDRPFGHEVEEIAAHWCARAGIAKLGSADIGHDIANKVVPFGRHR